MRKLRHSDIPDALTTPLIEALDLVELLGESGFLLHAKLNICGDDGWLVANADPTNGNTSWLGPRSMPKPDELPPWSVLLTLTLSAPVSAALLAEAICGMGGWTVSSPALVVRSGWCRTPVRGEPIELALTQERGGADVR